MTQIPNKERANRFLAKLRSDLRSQIKIGGMDQLPETRQGMVALAQRVYEGMQAQKSRHTELRKGTSRHQLPGNRNAIGPTNEPNNQDNQPSVISASRPRGWPRGRGRGRGRSLLVLQERLSLATKNGPSQKTSFPPELIRKESFVVTGVAQLTTFLKIVQNDRSQRQNLSLRARSEKLILVKRICRRKTSRVLFTPGGETRTQDCSSSKVKRLGETFRAVSKNLRRLRFGG